MAVLFSIPIRLRTWSRSGLAAAVLNITAGMIATPALGADVDAQGVNSNPHIERIVRLTTQGRACEAEQLCRNILHDHPDDSDVYRILLEIAMNRQMPVESHSFSSAQSRLPAVFNLHQSDRFVLLSDADAARITQHARWVERTYEEFQRFAVGTGLRPLPLQHKLVCILFEDHDDYRDFARNQDGVTNDAISGYYSPRNDRVVFSLQNDVDPHTPTLATGASGRRGVVPQPVERRVHGFNEQGHAASDGNLGSVGHDGHDHSACATESAAKCVHETIHQLMFHTRIMAADTQYPLWICEGLSTAFETDSPEEPFGPDVDYAPRLNAFRSMLAQGDLIPLQQLVTMTHLPANDFGGVWKVYQQSYALVTWACRHKPRELRFYLASMSAEPPGKLSARRHLQLFEQAFGNADEVEKAWLEFERERLK